MKLHQQNHYNGGVKASRNNPKCYSKQDQKERLIIRIHSDKEMSFPRKDLSLETAYISSSISEKLKNLLQIGTSGDVSSKGENSNLHTIFQMNQVTQHFQS